MQHRFTLDTSTLSGQETEREALALLLPSGACPSCAARKALMEWTLEPHLCVVRLTCTCCGWFDTITLEELHDGRREAPCAVCGAKTRGGTCGTCAEIFQEFGPISTIHVGSVFKE